MHKILGFDVSNNICSVALSINDNIIAYEEIETNKAAEKLFDMIENVLKQSNTHYQDIDYLAVTNGPGSFTGIRIGLASAKGIIAASNKYNKVLHGFAITNFDILYYRAKLQLKNLKNALIIIDAYREQSYVQIYENEIVSDTKLIDNNSVRNILINYEDIVCVGSDLKNIYQDIKDIKGVTILPRFSIIKAIHICRLAHIKIINKEPLIPIEPLYIRLPDAKTPL